MIEPGKTSLIIILHFILIIRYELKQIRWHIANTSLPTVVSLDRFIVHVVNISTQSEALAKQLRSRDNKLLDKTSAYSIVNRSELCSRWNSNDKWQKSCNGTGWESLWQSYPPVNFCHCCFKMASLTPDNLVHSGVS